MECGCYGVAYQCECAGGCVGHACYCRAAFASDERHASSLIDSLLDSAQPAWVEDYDLSDLYMASANHALLVREWLAIVDNQ